VFKDNTYTARTASSPEKRNITEEGKTRKTITSGPQPEKNYLTFPIPYALEELNKPEG